MQSFDYIVIGAGSAGCVLANRLTEDKNVRLLLLEAGGPDRHPWLKMPIAFLKMSQNSNYLWRFEGEPEPGLGGRRLALRRGRALGGSSTINGMIFARGHRRDFDLLRQQGLDGWGYADCLPYFKKLESSWRGESKFHGGSGPIKVTAAYHRSHHYEEFAEAAQNYGLPARGDYNAGESYGVSPLEFFIGDGERQSTASRYLRPALARPGLTVQTHATTLRILLSGNKAVGVEYHHEGQVKQVFAEREVILSAGPYHSPKILMLSGIGPADHLKENGIAVAHDLPGVGENLSDHAIFELAYRARGKDTFLSVLRLDRAIGHGINWHLFRQGPFGQNVASGMTYFYTRPGLERPDMQMINMGVSNDARLWFPIVAPRTPDIFTARIGPLYPRSRGWVKLRSADPAAPPRILFNMFGVKEDIDEMVRGVRIARDIHATKPYADLLAEELAPGAGAKTDAEIEQAVRASSINREHALGTCKMGVDAMAVVDARLKLRGIDNLRVVDSSVLPDQTGGNINIPTIMAAEKGADFIRGQSLPPMDG